LPGLNLLSRTNFSAGVWRRIRLFFKDYANQYLYITDDNGFIADVDDPPVALEKSADTYRVIVLGGSTVMGQGAPRPSQNIVGMLRKATRLEGC
jgi:hypothetical protein